MPGTPRATLRSLVGGPVRRLAVALLVAVLAGCGGGGDSGSGSGAASGATRSATDLGASPPVEGSGQPEEQRTRAGGNQGGFSTAGNVSANAGGIWPTARIELSSSTGASFTATVTGVQDCAIGSTRAKAGGTIKVVNGRTPAPVEFTLTGDAPPGPRKICMNVTIAGETRFLTASGTVLGSEDTDQTPGNQTPGNRTPGTPDRNPGGESPAGPEEGTGSENPPPSLRAPAER